MIQSVQTTMLALTTNVWILVVSQSLVENKLSAKPPLIDPFAAAHLIGLAIHMKNVINVGFLFNRIVTIISKYDFK